MPFHRSLPFALAAILLAFGCSEDDAGESDLDAGDPQISDAPADLADMEVSDDLPVSDMVDMDDIEDGDDALADVDLSEIAEDVSPDLAEDVFPWDWNPEVEPDWPEITPSPLNAGAASGTLDLPVGVPLACFTGRARFATARAVDNRDTPYAVGFVPSAGVQTRIPLHVVWLESGGRHAVLVKVDIGYAFDGLTRALETSIGTATGVDLTDRVFLATSHSHSSYGDYSQAHMLFLGHDRYNPEIFDRIVRQTADIAAIAHEALEPAAIGVGIDPDFDPDNQIYRSRRGAHHGLVDDFGQVVGPGYKDGNLYLVRIDASQGTTDPSDDEPIAVLFDFGIHGTIMDIDNALATSESTGAIELKLMNLFPEPVTVMHLQGSVGDMSPAGVQGGFARMESVGERAAPRILSLWEAVETSSEPLKLEALVRTVSQGRDIRVSRNGAVDLYYLPYQLGYRPDMLVYGEDGLSINPYDEFIAQYGAAMCGDPELVIPVANMGVEVYPYASCVLIEKVADLYDILFDMGDYYGMEYPLWETRSTMIGALSLDEVPVTVLGEQTRTEQVVVGFLPGEVCTMLSRSFQKRLADEQGVTTSFVVGVSMDHEGYLLMVEDWMRGGYEPAINAWGPLQGEYILDRLLELTELLQTDDAEHPAFPDYRDQEYPDWPMEPVAPDASPGCGTVPETLPARLWTRDGIQPAQAQPDPVIRRVADIAGFVFVGGDPVIDLPTVTLQREVTADSGEFSDVLLPDGLPLTDRGYDMILSYTPDPLRATAEVPDRHHYWLVEWQAVTDRPGLSHMAGLPPGRYRLVARGVCPDVEDTDYPFEGIPYQVESALFEVTGENVLTVSIAGQNENILTLAVSYRASPRGFRLLHMDSDYRTPTPLVGGDLEPTATVEMLAADGLGEPLKTWSNVAAVRTGDASYLQIDLGDDVPGSYHMRVTDVFGNWGMD